MPPNTCPTARRVPFSLKGIWRLWTLKRTRHSAEQIVTTLRTAEAMLAAGRSVAQVVQHLGVSE
jgi:hypothetical protein